MSGVGVGGGGGVPRGGGPVTQGGSRCAPLPWAIFSLPLRGGNRASCANSDCTHKQIPRTNRLRRPPRLRPDSKSGVAGAGSGRSAREQRLSYTRDFLPEFLWSFELELGAG